MEPDVMIEEAFKGTPIIKSSTREKSYESYKRFTERNKKTLTVGRNITAALLLSLFVYGVTHHFSSSKAVEKEICVSESNLEVGCAILNCLAFYIQNNIIKPDDLIPQYINDSIYHEAPKIHQKSPEYEQMF